jgi:hypothetical protein
MTGSSQGAGWVRSEIEVIVGIENIDLTFPAPDDSIAANNK